MQLPADLKYKWIFDQSADCWLCGTPEDGCGVYYDSDTDTWEGNIVVSTWSNHLFAVSAKTLEECLREAEKEFDRINGLTQ